MGVVWTRQGTPRSGCEHCADGVHGARLATMTNRTAVRAPEGPVRMQPRDGAHQTGAEFHSCDDPPEHPPKHRERRRSGRVVVLSKDRGRGIDARPEADPMTKSA